MRCKAVHAIAAAGVVFTPISSLATDVTPANSASVAQASSIPEDLARLMGKRVVVGRVPLCTPNTFQPNLAYAGQTATVIGFKPNQSLGFISLNQLPPDLRAMMANMKKGGVLLLQFQDGTKLDTCGPQGSIQLSPNIDLAPGEVITSADGANSAQPTQVQNPSNLPISQSSAAQRCPITITKVASGNSFGHALVDALTTSEFERQLDTTIHGGAEKHYLDVQVRNDSGRPVKAFEFAAAYSDRMGDGSASATFVSQNDKPIKAGGVFKTFAMDRDLSTQNGTGEITVYIGRVRFEDDTFWQDNGNRSCAMKTTLK